VALCTLPFGWVLPSIMQTVLLVLIGLIGGVAQIFLTLSYRFAPASVVAPFEYTAMLFSLMIGYVFFNELPTLQMLIGAGIIIMAGLVIILREAQLGLKRGASKAVKPPA
jgi:drug/metabolite transporter (DMT)-like permease